MDGDTIAVTAQVWIGLSITINVRIRGIDTPEIRGSCPYEKTLAIAARDRLALLVGGAVRLANVENDKFGGRVVADVSAGQGIDLGAAMIAGGFARSYFSGPRGEWCSHPRGG